MSKSRLVPGKFCPILPHLRGVSIQVAAICFLFRGLLNSAGAGEVNDLRNQAFSRFYDGLRNLPTLSSDLIHDVREKTIQPAKAATDQSIERSTSAASDSVEPRHAPPRTLQEITKTFADRRAESSKEKGAKQPSSAVGHTDSGGSSSERAVVLDGSNIEKEIVFEKKKESSHAGR